MFADSALVTQYANQIKGLSLQQAELALSTKMLTNEQKQQILAEAGLIAAENTIQAELLQTTLAQAGLNTAKQNAILKDLELMNIRTDELLTQKACTKATLEEQLAVHGVTGAQAENIISTLGLSGANTTATASFSLMTKAIWANVKATVAWLATNPVGWCVLAVAAIYALVKANNALEKSEEEAAQAAAEARKEALENAEAYKNEVDSLKDLQTRYTELITSTNDVSTIKRELSSIQDELVEKYGEEADNIDLVNGKYSEQLKLMREKRKEEAEEYVRNNKANYETAVAEMSEEATIWRASSTSRATTNGVSLKLGAFENWSNKTLDNWSKLENVVDPRKYAAGQRGEVFLTGTLEEQYDTLVAMADLYSQQEGYHKDRYQLIINEANKLKEQIESNKQIIAQYESEESLLENIGTNIYPQTNDEYKFDQLVDKALELNSILQDESITPTAYVNAEKELQNIKTQMDEFAQNNPLFQSDIETLFSSIEKGALSASTSLSSLKEKFSEYFDDSFTPALDNITKIEEAMQTIANGDKLDWEDAWDVIELDADGILEDIRSVDGEIQFSTSQLIQLKDALIQKQIEQIEMDTEEAKSAIKTAKIRLASEEAIVKAQQLTVNSPGDLAVLEREKQVVADIKSEISGYENIISKNNLLVKQLNSHFGDTVDITEAINNNISKLNEEIDTLQEKADNLLKAQEDKIDGIIDKLEDEKDVMNSQLEVLEAQQEEIEGIISNYEKVADIVGDEIQKEIDAIEEQRQQVEDYYDNLIENLRESNEEREDALDMAEKLAALENAKNNKVRVYREDSGWVYETDKEALKNAENDLLSAQNEAEIKKLEKEKEKATEGFDEQIESLEEYAELWQEVVESITNSENELTAVEILGSDWREKIKNKDTAVLNQFKTNFTSYNTQLKQLVDNEIASLKKSIEGKEAEIKSWQDYKTQIQSAAKDIEDAYNGYAETLNQITLSENSNWSERQANLASFTSAYTSYIDQISAKNGEIQTMSANLEGLANAMGNLGNSSFSSALSNASFDLQSAINEMNSLLDKLKTNPIKFGIINSAADKERYDLLISLAKELGIPGFSQGGIHDTTGLAMMHGTRSASEVTFNANDAKKLYELVHNTPNLISSMKNSILRTVENSGTSSVQSVGSGKSVVTHYHEWKFGNIVTNDPLTFARLINEYFETKVTESKVF